MVKPCYQSLSDHNSTWLEENFQVYISSQEKKKKKSVTVKPSILEGNYFQEWNSIFTTVLLLFLLL